LTPISKKILPFSLILAGSVILAACSSKPSPWTESSSPWDNQAAQNVDPEAQTYDDIQPVSPAEETIDPIGYGAEEEFAPAGAEGYMLTPEVEAAEEPLMASSAGGLGMQPAGLYAVQVVASSSMDKLMLFASRHQLSDEWIAETTVDGRVWFVLMSGVYQTKSEAEQALMGLQDLGTQPWIRTVGSVQSVMNQ